MPMTLICKARPEPNIGKLNWQVRLFLLLRFLMRLRKILQQPPAKLEYGPNHDHERCHDRECRHHPIGPWIRALRLIDVGPGHFFM